MEDLAAHVPSPAHTLPLPRLSVDLMRAARRSDDIPDGWTDNDIARALLRYRRFLALVAESPTTPIAPTRDIDFMWHLHMLSPRAYHADCMRLFGDILDHDGGFGKEPDEEPVLIAVFEATARRYAAAFGEPLALETDGATKCWHDCSGRCWHACSSKVELTPAPRARRPPRHRQPPHSLWSHRHHRVTRPAPDASLVRPTSRGNWRGDSGCVGNTQGARSAAIHRFDSGIAASRRRVHGRPGVGAQCIRDETARRRSSWRWCCPRFAYGPTWDIGPVQCDTRIELKADWSGAVIAAVAATTETAWNTHHHTSNHLGVRHADTFCTSRRGAREAVDVKPAYRPTLSPCPPCPHWPPLRLRRWAPTHTAAVAMLAPPPSPTTITAYASSGKWHIPGHFRNFRKPALPSAHAAKASQRHEGRKNEACDPAETDIFPSSIVGTLNTTGRSIPRVAKLREIRHGDGDQIAPSTGRDSASVAATVPPGKQRQRPDRLADVRVVQ